MMNQVLIEAKSYGDIATDTNKVNIPIPFMYNGQENRNPLPPEDLLAGIQVMVIHSASQNVLFHNYYGANQFVVVNGSEIWTKAIEEVTMNGLNNPENILVLATFGWDYNLPPIGENYNWLMNNGAGQKLFDWLNSAGPNNQSYGGQSASYILISRFMSQQGSGHESYNQSFPGPAIASLGVYVGENALEAVPA